MAAVQVHPQPSITNVIEEPSVHTSINAPIIADVDRAAGSASPSPSTSSSAATADSTSKSSTGTTKSAASSTSTFARLSALARASTKLHFIAALIPGPLGPKQAAALIHIQAPPPIMTIEFKPLVLAPVEFSLTDGTDIPAPLDSPPATPVDDAKLESVDDFALNGDKAEKENVPPTPTTPTTSHTRKSGIRRFLSIRTLGGQARLSKTSPSKASSKTNTTVSRPGTSMSADSLAVSSPIAHSLKHRKSMGWFGTRRKSQATLVNLPSPKETGPPPPIIPELKMVEAEMEADNMFDNIN
jgi:hypothetical protein